MSLFNIIPVLAGDREKETVELMKQHTSLVYDVVAEFREAFFAYSKKDFPEMEEKVKHVCELESRADDLRREIEEKMYSGAFLPGSRNLIFNFSETVDKVADAAEAAARILVFLEEKEATSEILTLLELEIDDGLDTIKTLQSCIADLGDISDVKNAISRVREKEHESDEIAAKTYSVLYRDIKDPISVLLLSKFITYVGDISDRAEDATDELSLILLINKA